jgi:DNA-binding transcriptional ArsR family regulator
MSSGSSKYQHIIESYLDDPERFAIATTLAEGPKSAAQLAEIVGIPPARVRRHIRKMREEGVVESASSEAKRGAVEHFHFVSGGLEIEEEQLAELTLDQRRRITAYFLKVLLTDATKSLITHPRSPGLERTDGPLTRIPIQIDEEGWKELANMHTEFYRRVLESRDRIAERLREKGEEGFKASSVIMLFESETAD